MKIKWLGHAAFLITADEGTKIITDPYTPGEFGLEYKPIDEAADIVTKSHDHADHNNTKAVPGNPQIITGDGKHWAKGIELNGIASCHDECGGKERGDNTIFVFTIDDVTICHAGDLGHTLTDEETSNIGPIDVLMVPVGGNFTIDAKGADKVIEQLKPKVVIPMHFQNDRCPNFPVANAEPFLAGKTNVKHVNDSKIELKSGRLPSATEIIVLNPAL
ncbi:MAG: MBL fold metallo-hydrolase [Chloroflexota bacterium]|nr:MBL fold metallo-hydrolase [Chloroflexota bacterium]